MNTMIGIPARGSKPAGNRSTGNGKKKQIVIDTVRLSELSDQLSELVEELDDIREDLHEMLADIENHYDLEDYADGTEDTPYDQLEASCDTVDSAYQELNEALDGMESSKE